MREGGREGRRRGEGGKRRGCNRRVDWRERGGRRRDRKWEEVEWKIIRIQNCSSLLIYVCLR